MFLFNLGGGLGGTRRGGPEVNLKHSGREDNERERERYAREMAGSRSGRSVTTERDRERDYRDRDRDREREPRRPRSRDRERKRHRSKSYVLIINNYILNYILIESLNIIMLTYRQKNIQYILFLTYIIFLDVHGTVKGVVAETVVLEMRNMMKLRKFLFLQRLEIKIEIAKEKGNVVALGIVNIRRIAKTETVTVETSKLFFLSVYVINYNIVFLFIEVKIVVINMIKIILNVKIKFILNKNLLMVSKSIV